MGQYVSHSDVITRKDHKCLGCLCTIPKGDKVRRTVWKDMGEISSFYLCDICVKILNTEFEYGDEFSEGDLVEAYPEYYKDRWKEA